MNHIRKLALIALAVFAFAALADASTASANENVLCKENEEPCNPENRYVPPTSLEAKLQEGTALIVLTSIGNVKCTESTLTGETTEDENETLEGEVASLTFSGCKLGGTSCTMTAANLPYAIDFAATESGNGTTAFKNGGKGEPKFAIVCGKALNCTYGGEPTLQFEGGNPGIISASGVELSKKVGFLCPATASLDATFAFQNPPGPLFLRRGKTALCTANEVRCAGANTHMAGTEVESELEGGTEATFTNPANARVTGCTESNFDWRTGAEAAQPLPTTTLVFTFGNCLTATCSVTVPAANPGQLRASGNGNGKLRILTPQIRLSCGNPVTLECVFEKPAMILDVTGSILTPKIKAVNLPLSVKQQIVGTCPEPIRFTATYEVSSPAPLFVTGK